MEHIIKKLKKKGKNIIKEKEKKYY